MNSAPRWDIEGRSWPHRLSSHFVETPGLIWHVQQMGQGPVALLLHGTGAATHSWRSVMPLLADGFTIIAPDLPGHGFTRGRPTGGLTLTAMACAIGHLLVKLEALPMVIAGHSAGAAIALQMSLANSAQTPVVGLNPALMPFPGLAARLFPSLARMLFVNPLVPRMLAGIARMPGETERFLLRATGSTIDAQGLAGYRALMSTAAHCGSAMEMMASWDLETLSRQYASIAAPVMLVHSDGDSAVPLASVEKAAALLPNARLEVLPGLGHLAHEERPDLAAQFIRDHASTTGREAS
ncbi:alpha/beta fold hydrolase BchO [Novosphingobium cyanobacteriorum]|uniref:Alpha/beta fold hydrolase n=1 Tax=Novosphingobium cyanobacteriorum TaxID=3024215 RepID=A0ABT6CR50_9SPHN|nr:alpha/beta fold hydrolase BchO [Novosphingobium cyanobacteriorum]MDF8335745.1 alpha/beta fold hydrolase [Novosphingobium cyanobacteriorum]